MKKLQSIVFILIIIQIPVQSYAQKQGKEQIDSLQAELKKVKQDTSKVNILNDLSWALINTSNYDTALNYADEALQLAQKLHFKKGTAGAYNNIGIAYFEQSNYPEALKNYFAVLKIREETGNKKGVAGAYNNIGMTYAQQGNYPEALKNHFAALKIREKAEDKRDIARSYSNIGYVYAQQGNYPEALKSHFATLKILEETGDKIGIAYTYNNIGSIYDKQGNYSEALKNYFASLKIFGENGNKGGTAIFYKNIGVAYTKLNQAEEGKKWLQKALALSKEINIKGEIKNSYGGLAAADSTLSNWKGAYENYKMYIVYRDSIDNEETKVATIREQMTYDFEKKEIAAKTEQEKKDIRQRTIRNFLMGGLLVFIFFSVIIYRQRNKVKKEKNRSDSLLLNILPEEIAEELKEKGSTQAKQFDEVSILFTDFVNFTQSAEQLSPEQLVRELNECFTAFDNIMERNGLEKIKTIGDAYMAVCGLPASDPQHAKKTIQAALEIRDFIEEKSKKEKTFEIRIGIHSGSVVAGIVGVKKFAYDIWGDTVNTAARMEQSGEPGKVNISETTYQLAQNDFIFAYRGEIEAKNKGKMKMYFVEPKNGNMDFEKTKEFILEKLERELPKKLAYHNVKHVLDVYQASAEYARLEGINEEATILLKTASLFHDSGFIVQAAGHEQISCDIAQEYLPEFGYSQQQIDQIKGMIMATKIPQSPTNHLEQIISDADLDYLGRDDFEEISECLFMELEIKDRNEWNKIQISFFEKHHYFTESAKRLRNEKKQQNLEKIISQTKL